MTLWNRVDVHNLLFNLQLIFLQNSLLTNLLLLTFFLSVVPYAMCVGVYLCCGSFTYRWKGGTYSLTPVLRGKLKRFTLGSSVFLFCSYIFLAALGIQPDIFNITAHALSHYDTAVTQLHINNNNKECFIYSIIIYSWFHINLVT